MSPPGGSIVELRESRRPSIEGSSRRAHPDPRRGRMTNPGDRVRGITQASTKIFRIGMVKPPLPPQQSGPLWHRRLWNALRPAIIVTMEHSASSPE
ncbi:hypothetical protein R1flu_005558 [Riccia fluitans]|uniref:Uncharacterized protein n=1 Tax=Riccia fluitans TaxID=41844 RepID=A0ABD1YUG2_9MARC